MCESTAPSKRKRTLKICIIILIVIIALLGVLTVFAYLLFPRARHGAIEHKNHEARKLEYEIAIHLESLQLPENETVILMGEFVQGEHFVMGEYAWDRHLMIYANQWIAQDTYIYHSAAPFEDTNYWAMRITEDAREVWYDDKPIAESSLREYTYEEQEESVHFRTPFTSLRWYCVGWRDSSDLIGYFKTNKY